MTSEEEANISMRGTSKTSGFRGNSTSRYALSAGAAAVFLAPKPSSGILWAVASEAPKSNATDSMRVRFIVTPQRVCVLSFSRNQTGNCVYASQLAYRQEAFATGARLNICSRFHNYHLVVILDLRETGCSKDVSQESILGGYKRFYPLKDAVKPWTSWDWQFPITRAVSQ